MSKILKRSKNQLVAGVCAGFADYLGWDVTLVRILYAIISIFSAGFPGVLVYIACWLIMPVEE